MQDIYEQNKIIEEAIETAAKSPSRENSIYVLEMIRFCMHKGGEFIIPVDIPASEIDKLDGVDVRVGEPIKSKENVKLQLKALKGKNGNMWFSAFTSNEELRKGAMTFVISCKIAEFFNLVLNTKECVGVAINAFGQPFMMKKDLIQMVFDANKQKNQIFLEKGDITKSKCNCIVNAANNSLLGGGGVDGAIHAAAGPQLLEACRALKGCKTGEAKITRGYRLNAQYIIHTVGPIYSENREKECEQLLRSCYWKSLELARENNIHSIAFPAISTGAYRYPLKKAVPIAVGTLSRWLSEHEDYGMAIVITCFNEETYRAYQSFMDFCIEQKNKKVDK
ncbi:MAG: O-acetyl-ADP-ribose deacetylase [Lachnospiraceae bacterium]